MEKQLLEGLEVLWIIVAAGAMALLINAVLDKDEE